MEKLREKKGFICDIKILFYNVYKETLLIFRSKKLNIGKVFHKVVSQFLREHFDTFLVSIQCLPGHKVPDFSFQE